MSIISRGFGRRRGEEAPPGRLPPGQYATGDFPILSAGPTPRVHLDDWILSVATESGSGPSWTWEEFVALPMEQVTVDIHCVTKWSKFDTTWEGVSVDILLAGLTLSGSHVMAHSYGGYTTNLPLADVTGGKAWVVHRYGGEPLDPAHGGPARLLVPHLYFWKSAKWVQRFELMPANRPGFWESYGYHDYGDPWHEQRYAGD